MRVESVRKSRQCAIAYRGEKRRVRSWAAQLWIPVGHLLAVWPWEVACVTLRSCLTSLFPNLQNRKNDHNLLIQLWWRFRVNAGNGLRAVLMVWVVTLLSLVYWNLDWESEPGWDNLTCSSKVSTFTVETQSQPLNPMTITSQRMSAVNLGDKWISRSLQSQPRSLTRHVNVISPTEQEMWRSSSWALSLASGHQCKPSYP